MKLGKKRKSACNRESFNSNMWRNNVTFEDYKKVIKALNILRCEKIVENDEGYSLPNSMGRIVILKLRPRVKNIYSMTQPGTRIYNIHSFGYVYRVFHKERLLLRYPVLYKFRPHRQGIKVPLYNHIMNGTKEYYRQSDHNPYELYK